MVVHHCIYSTAIFHSFCRIFQYESVSQDYSPDIKREWEKNYGRYGLGLYCIYRCVYACSILALFVFNFDRHIISARLRNPSTRSLPQHRTNKTTVSVSNITITTRILCTCAMCIYRYMLAATDFRRLSKDKSVMWCLLWPERWSSEYTRNMHA